MYKRQTFACIGLGDCTKVCKFDAIHIVDGVAKVDKDKCTGCGASVSYTHLDVYKRQPHRQCAVAGLRL